MNPLHLAWKAGHAARCAAAGDAPAPVYVWKVTHVADDGTSRVQQVIAPSNVAADDWMATRYGLPRFSSALRLSAHPGAAPTHG